MEKNRNTNFTGEILLYLSFAVLSNEIAGFAALAFVWSTVFVSRIHLKEKSLSKKEGYAHYKQNSYLLIFKIFSSDALNLLFYGGFSALSYLIWRVGGIEATVNLLLNR